MSITSVVVYSAYEMPLPGSSSIEAQKLSPAEEQSPRRESVAEAPPIGTPVSPDESSITATDLDSWFGSEQLSPTSEKPEKV